jgi:Flp pilus assembly pilin Flp
MNAIRRFLFEDDAVTAAEYAVMLSLIILVMIGAITTFGQGTGGMWGGIDSDLAAAGFGN